MGLLLRFYFLPSGAKKCPCFSWATQIPLGSEEQNKLHYYTFLQNFEKISVL